MKLTYETATATLIQFIVLGLLNIANSVYSIVTTCRHPGGDCVVNLFSSLIFYIFVTGWFGVVCVLGYLAQDRRSKRWAELRIMAEAGVSLVALFNIKLKIKSHRGLLSPVPSLVDVALAVWIISLPFRLMRAGGGRVVAR